MTLTAISDLNWIGIVLASMSALAIGGLWYSPLFFETAWRLETKLSPDDLAGRNMGVVFGLALTFSFILALTMSLVIRPKATPASGLGIGLLVSLGWVVPSLWVIALFEAKSVRYVLINGGYLTATLVAMGAILGAL